MSEIIAKVAQAIIDAHRERVDAFTVARRAIEAMREPTEGMLWQGEQMLIPNQPKIRGPIYLASQAAPRA